MPSFRQVVSRALLFGCSALSVGRSVFAQTMGWTYTMKMDTDSGTGAANRQSIATQYRTVAHKFRSEYVQATGSMGAIEGTYQIFNDADSSMTMVMPAQRMATIMSLPAALQMTGGGIRMGATHVTSQEITDLGAGEKILGHATRHIRIALSGTTEWSMMGQRCVQPLDTQMDLWVAPGVDLGAAMGSMKTMAALAGPASPKDIESRLAAMSKGSSLRTVLRSTRADATGVMRTVTSSMEIVELTYGPLADDLFVVPAGYRTMNLNKMMAAMPAGMVDSAAMQSASAKLMATMCGHGTPP